MQTFITDLDMAKSFANLDNKRLGKQRVETIQIAHVCLGLSEGWKNHPAVKMWKGYEEFLIAEYLRLCLREWAIRGFNSYKCITHYENLLSIIHKPMGMYKKPIWITEDFIESHRSNLIRKNREFYKPLWPDVEENLPYIWPVQKVKEA